MNAVQGCPRGPSTAVAACEHFRVSGVGEGRDKAGVMRCLLASCRLFCTRGGQLRAAWWNHTAQETSWRGCDPRRPPGADVGDEPVCPQTEESRGEGLWAASPRTRSVRGRGKHCFGAGQGRGAAEGTIRSRSRGAAGCKRESRHRPETSGQGAGRPWDAWASPCGAGCGLRGPCRRPRRSPGRGDPDGNGCWLGDGLCLLRSGVSHLPVRWGNLVEGKLEKLPGNETSNRSKGTWETGQGKDRREGTLRLHSRKRGTELKARRRASECVWVCECVDGQVCALWRIPVAKSGHVGQG